MNTCKRHPKYKALMQPHVLCKECWVFFYENTELAYQAALKQIQKSCKHANMVECDYSKGYSTLPPRRACKDCGLAEDGWGVGYVRLRSKHEYSDTLRELIPLVSRDRVNSYMLTLSDQ